MEPELENLINEILGYGVKSLIKTSSEFNFKEIKGILDNLFSNLSSTIEHPEFFDTILDLQPLKSTLKQLDTILGRIKNFNALDSSNPSNERQELINQVKSLNNDLDNLFLQKFLVYDLKKKLERGKNKELEKKLQKEIQEIRTKSKDAKEILSNLRKTTGNVGVTEYEEVFGKQSEINKRSARKWLIASIGSGIIFLLILAVIFLRTPNENIEGYIWYVSINRIMLFSIMGYLLYQFIKNYHTNMHLCVKNLHRRNCLRVFEKIRDSSNNEEVKDEILKQASKTIFESGETGYLRSKEEGSDIGIINIVDKIGNSFRKHKK